MITSSPWVSVFSFVNDRAGPGDFQRPLPALTAYELGSSLEGGCREHSFGPAAGSVQQALCGRSRHPGVGVARGSSLPPVHPAAAALAKPSSCLPPPASPHPEPIWLPPVLFQKRNTRKPPPTLTRHRSRDDASTPCWMQGSDPPFRPRLSHLRTRPSLLPGLFGPISSPHVYLETFRISPPREAFPESPGKA